jgi:ribonuclease P protein component
MGSGRVCAPGPDGPSLADDGLSGGPGSAPRLRRSSDIRRALRTGASRSSGRVVLYVAPGEGPSRAAWITGKRVGSAVARNRARRLLREAWIALAPVVRGGYDLVMVARGPFRKAGAPELTAEIEELLRRAGLIES